MFELEKLSNIRRGSVKNGGGNRAPHKPIFLLTLIALVDQRIVKENRFHLNHQMTLFFKEIWSSFVNSQIVKPKIFLPFYHLSNDYGIWNLHTKQSSSISLTSGYSPRSFSSLHDNIDYAELDKDLFKLLENQKSRNAVWRYLTTHFFPEKQAINVTDILSHQEYETISDKDLEQVFAEPKDKYWKEIDLVTRNSYFKSRIPEIYDYTCAISRLKLEVPHHKALLNACHIEPWSKRYNDSIKNGICLTQTIHTAFDNYLLTISEDYNLVVASNVKHKMKGQIDFSKLANQPIHLPDDERLYPSQDLLEEHRTEFYRKF